jgi:TonB-dependent SusC/RagA subfamily outer membrane receptor
MKYFSNFFFLFTIWSFCCSHFIIAQDQINGKIIDEDTGQPIASCRIYLESSSVEATSNALGEFVIAVDSLPIKIIFAHANYEQKVMTIFDTDTISVSLISIREEAPYFITSTSTQKARKASDDPFIKTLRRKTDRHNAFNPMEKTFLHTDKDIFSTGETIWYSAYVLIGPFHQYSTGSKVIHVDLIGSDGEILISQTHELTRGRAAGSLQIPKNILPGNYQLRSYTQWMRNFDFDFFFIKKLKILGTGESTELITPEETQIDLQFLPEGGHMVSGIPGKVSFKALYTDGRPTIIRGRVLNSSGSSVATLSTFDRGAGFFQLTPKKGEQYKALLEDGSEYDLPKAVDSGYAISVNNLNKKKIKIFVQASEALQGNPFYVVGHMRQRNYFAEKFEFKRNSMVALEISKKDLPSGVLTVTVFDLKNKPWCERAVFINKEEELLMAANINGTLEKRGQIALDIKVTDFEGKPVATALSIAVTDKGQVVKSQGSKNMLTHLLLESEIKGQVLNPGFLFGDQKEVTEQKLDLIMLTHGWRKYNWPEVWNDAKPIKEFDFQKGLTVSGKAMDAKNRPLPNLTLNVFAKSDETVEMFSPKTLLDGQFSIDNFNFNGSNKVVFNAVDYKNKPLDLKIRLDPKKQTAEPTEFKGLEIWETDENETYTVHSTARRRMDQLYETNKVTKLDEVIVTEKKKEESKRQTEPVFGLEPDATLYAEDHIAMQTVLQLVRLFAGVSVMGNYVSIRNEGSPLWVLNGIPVSSPGSPSGSQSGFAGISSGRPTPSIIANMPVFDVERIEILKGARAAIWGARGANGVILIYTKKGEGQTYDPVLSPDFTISGHTPEKEFYSPKYDLKRDEHIAPDYRATLYWNPNINTDENGNAKLEFFNSDTAKEIQVSIEALSENGTPGTYLETFGTKNQPQR